MKQQTKCIERYAGWHNALDLPRSRCHQAPAKVFINLIIINHRFTFWLMPSQRTIHIYNVCILYSIHIRYTVYNIRFTFGEGLDGRYRYESYEYAINVMLCYVLLTIFLSGFKPPAKPSPTSSAQLSSGRN